MSSLITSRVKLEESGASLDALNDSNAQLQKDQLDTAKAVISTELATPSIWLRAKFFLFTVLPEILNVLIYGKGRATRSTQEEIFIRVFRRIALVKNLDLETAQLNFVLFRELGKKQSNTIIAKYHYDQVEWKSTIVPIDQASKADNSTIIVPSKLVTRPLPTTNLTADWVYPRDGDYNHDEVILYFHGGAFVSGSKSTYRDLVGPITSKLKRRLFNVEYRLSPQSQYPAALHDAVSAYLYLLKANIDTSKICIMGDSAGGNLAITTCLFLRDHGHPLPACAILLSPWSDLTGEMPSYKENEIYDYIKYIDPGSPTSPIVAYCGASNWYNMVRNDPYISPILATRETRSIDASGKLVEDMSEIADMLPPIYICTGADEVLLDENILLASKLPNPGMASRVQFDTFEHEVHVFPFIARQSVNTMRVWQRIQGFISNLENQKAYGSLQIAFWRRGELDKDLAFFRRRWNLIRKIKQIEWTPEFYNAKAAI